ncbi:O-methyltransferase ZRP4 [Hordeum vulgare]|nr:O-methyltransferase ZRP4 [Hordeum vulgare]
MAAEAPTVEVSEEDGELLRAQADLWRHSFGYVTSMGLRCAVKLGVPTAIHHLGGVTSLPDLTTALSLPPSKMPYLRRLMRLLVSTGVFAKAESSSEEGAELFRLNALSKILVDGDGDEHHGHTSLVLAATSSQYLEASLGLAEWFKKDFGEAPVPSPFEDVHGVPLLDERTASLDEEFDELVNDAVAAHDNLGIDMIVRECHYLFKGLESVTDCCGGDGTTARAIIDAHPHLKCNVLDLPKVIEKAPAHDIINYVAGDMFQAIPPAQAVMLKFVLHNWNDEDCVNILDQCKKATPSREEGGKVIIIDILVNPSLEPIIYESQMLFDVGMMTLTKGRHRDENDWGTLFMKAGFSEYKIVKKLGDRVVFEVYP